MFCHVHFGKYMFKRNIIYRFCDINIDLCFVKTTNCSWIHPLLAQCWVGACVRVCVRALLANSHRSCNGTIGSTADERGEDGCWHATFRTGRAATAGCPLPESGAWARVRRSRQIPSLLLPPLQLAHSALGTADEVWSGSVQRFLPKPQNILFLVTKQLNRSSYFDVYTTALGDPQRVKIGALGGWKIDN